jgi:hypothetical protein
MNTYWGIKIINGALGETRPTLGADFGSTNFLVREKKFNRESDPSRARGESLTGPTANRKAAHAYHQDSMRVWTALRF